MAKKLAGKRWFEALGRRAASKGLPSIHGRSARQKWPMWARQAYARGWLVQGFRSAKAAMRGERP